MVGVFSLFVVVVLSLLITRVATIALTLTGLSSQAARFQARSAFSGTGFTTSEAESVVNHPTRRRIVMTLMLLGSAGTASVVASLLLSFSGLPNGATGLQRLAVIAGGLLVLLLLVRSTVADRWLTRALQPLLRRFTKLEARDYAGLLHLSDNWMVGEVRVRDHDWLAHHPLADLDLPAEGVLVLGIQRADGTWIGAPRSSTCVQPGDVAILYGPRDTLTALDHRRRDPDGARQQQASQATFEAQDRPDAGEHPNSS